ncbi:non-ribosomal peptide synthetase [Faunimonas pinastri]|uniref:non-ribosomal peptide synthetase n=1 Tax=Faunimonas pinastri TaxID=1855383 RepID=UPI0015A50241|nr:non-ribosomal peptide synthetase [Faunimonas pinastri]
MSRRAGGDRERFRIPRRAGEGPVPVSPEQEDVLSHAATMPGSPLYNESLIVRHSGPLDAEAMRLAFGEIVRRHEIWRTTMLLVDGQFVQTVHPPFPVELPVTDLGGLPPDLQEAEAARIARADAESPLCPSRLPLFRARLIRMGEEGDRLSCAAHHSILDSLSLQGRLLPELVSLYRSFAAGGTPPREEDELQYGDYAVWRRAQVADGRIERSLADWREMLAGPLPALQLPTDRPRSQNPGADAAAECFTIPPELSQALKQQAHSEGVTLFTLLLASFGVLLHRYSGQEDVIVGTVTDMRTRPELERMSGCFLNSLALRLAPAGEQTFRGYLARLRSTVFRSLGASEVPFERVLREVRPRRVGGRHPLFDAFFVLEPTAPALPSGWSFSPSELAPPAAKFDLWLDITDTGNHLAGRFIYRADLFDAETVRRMTGHLVTLMRGAVEHPDCRLGDLPLLTRAEEERFAAWNETRRPIPDSPVPALFRAEARRGPDAPAVTFGDRTANYAELDRLSDRLAARLLEAGAGPGKLVGVCMERSIDMVAALLAVMKSGGAYLPLDPGFPVARLQMICADAEPVVLLAEPKTRHVLAGSDIPVLVCDALDAGEETAWPALVKPALEDNGLEGIELEDMAYVLYTSGSTGRPKGVEISHRALVNLLASMAAEPGFSAVDSMLAVTTISFDIAGLELFLPLISGGRIVLASREAAADPRELAALIRTSDCSVMQATPATWRGLVESGWKGRADLRILCGGEALPGDLAEQLLTRCASLWNVYGPTETTIWSTVHKVARGERPVPVGRPLANTTCFILDKAGRRVPVGVPGELFIGGDGLARGYHGRPDLTADRFVSMPAAGGARVYRTGDLARFRGDGSIECLGRTDHQVKVRGFRIECGEVEAALQTHPGVAGAAVRIWPDASGAASLVGYIVARQGSEPELAEVRMFLRRLLPDYMVPSRLMRIAQLPMTPNRKVDRDALPPPGGEGLGGEGSGGEEPGEGGAAADEMSEKERRLARLWAEVLGRSMVGPTENFFELGGHSLLAMRLLNRIEEEFRCQLSMASIFHAPDVRGMALLLGSDDVAVPRTVNIQPRGSRPALFWLNAGPKYLPLAHELGVDQPFYGLELTKAEMGGFVGRVEVHDIAAHMIEAIRAVQPSGPYYIGGYCDWGIPAFEVAQQLIAAGETVGRLFVLDTPNPTVMEETSAVAVDLSRFRYHLGEMMRRRGRERWAYGFIRAQRAARRWLGRLPVEATEEEVIAFGNEMERKVHAYRPVSYPGDFVLLQPEKRADILNYTEGWRGMIRGAFESYSIPGSHEEILEEDNIRQLGRVIADCLQRSQTEIPMRGQEAA